MRLRSLLAMMVAALASACPAPSTPCNVDDDCSAEEVCVNGTCAFVVVGEGEGEGVGEGEGEGEAFCPLFVDTFDGDSLDGARWPGGFTSTHVVASVTDQANFVLDGEPGYTGISTVPMDLRGTMITAHLVDPPAGGVNQAFLVLENGVTKIFMLRQGDRLFVDDGDGVGEEILPGFAPVPLEWVRIHVTTDGRLSFDSSGDGVTFAQHNPVRPRRARAPPRASRRRRPRLGDEPRRDRVDAGAAGGEHARHRPGERRRHIGGRGDHGADRRRGRHRRAAPLPLTS